MNRDQLIQKMMQQVNEWESLDIQDWIREEVLPLLSDEQIKALGRGVADSFTNLE